MKQTIKVGATAMTTTGGTETTLSYMGRIGNLVKAFFSGDTSLKTRRTVECSVKEPAVNASSPGGMTQARRKVVFFFPRTLTVGGVSVQTADKLIIEHSTDISATAAEILEQRLLGGQFIVDPANNDFWQSLSLS